MTRITVRIPDELYQQLQTAAASRPDTPSTNKVILEGIQAVVGNRVRLLDEMLERGRLLISRWQDNELNLVADTCNGYGINVDLGGWYFAARGLPLEIHDAIKLNDYDTKWEVDGAMFIAQIQAAPIESLLALLDMSIRFWSDCNSFTTARDAIWPGNDSSDNIDVTIENEEAPTT